MVGTRVADNLGRQGIALIVKPRRNYKPVYIRQLSGWPKRECTEGTAAAQGEFDKFRSPWPGNSSGLCPANTMDTPYCSNNGCRSFCTVVLLACPPPADQPGSCIMTNFHFLVEAAKSALSQLYSVEPGHRMCIDPERQRGWAVIERPVQATGVGKARAQYCFQKVAAPS